MPACLRPTHRRRPPALARQRGVALILLITVLVIGVVWYTVGALGKAAPTAADREIITGHALERAKQALLAYVAQYASRRTTIEPGQMPCPEFLSSIGTSSQGQAGTSCSNASPTVGRLPWETLGIDEVRDGYGEPIWYVLSPGFRSAPINFGTPGQLTYNANPNAAVALLIAPGPALNTQSDPATPPAGCSKVNQQVSTRNTASLNPQNFLECGNDAGNNTIVGTSPWTNDRVIPVTAAEWARAIAGPVADRLQREVAPALNDWRTTESVANWGSSFLPFASPFSDPTGNSLCGSYNTLEGLPPVAGSASSTCTSWTSGNVTQLLGSLFSLGCSASGSDYVCRFINFSFFSPLNARITASAPRVAGSFRAPITAASITNDSGGTLSNFSLSLSSATGNANLSFDLSFPILAFFSTVTVTIPNLPDAALLSDARLSWFVANDWSRYTYYSLAQGAMLAAGSACSGAGDPGCLTLNGMPAASGNASDKRLVLALMGPGPVGAQTQPSNNPANYLESHTSGSTIYSAATVTSAFNDRLAACPFQQTPASGGPIAICN
jgi:hypothetical protein